MMPRQKNDMVVYTAIFGDYDNLKAPPDVPGCDFVCFTDNPDLRSDVYKIIYTEKILDTDSTREAKIFKILPHKYFKNHTYSLWIDGSVRIKSGKLREFVNLYLNKHDVALFAHPQRVCVYEELDACIKLQKDDLGVMRKQIERYKADGYPSKNGLATCTIILRRHHAKKLQKASEDWWEEIQRGSKRDQLSFNYVLWKNKLSYATIDGIVWDNEYFKVSKHRYKTLINECSKLTRALERKKRELNRKEQGLLDLQNSKSFLLGDLFFRSIKKPKKMLTFPYNFFRILIAAKEQSKKK